MHTTRILRPGLVAWSGALAFALAITARPALAATFAVDSTDDAVDASPGDGQCATASHTCTLRAAIEEANALPGPDTILLPAGTYLISREGSDDTCAMGDLDITSSISIMGDGAATTIVDGNHRDRVFDVLAEGAAVITGVTVRNGSQKDGGGIRVDHGTLKLVECAVTANQADDGGGGIENDFGVLEVVRSTIDGNVAHGNGGGVDNQGTADLRNVTLSGNTADGTGGGVGNSGTTTFNNCTLTQNTLTGVDTTGQVVFMNTILSNNAGPDCQGTLTSRGFNLIANPSGCTFDGDTSGDLVDKQPNLGPLQDNGGPTFTHALLTGSAALDAGNPAAPGSGDPACEETDQRGVARPQGPRCDIGAYEACATSGSADGAFNASPGGGFAACSGSCGNGTVDSGEQCDDGPSNGTPGDKCDAKCHLVPVPNPGNPTPGSPAVCGDGVVQPGEECDDGNTDDGDGCSSTCRLETPVSCDDGGNTCDQGCDSDTRFHHLNCILQTPVCTGEFVPPGLTKRLSKARHTLSEAWQSTGRHGKHLVSNASRLLGKCDKLRKGMERRGKVSPHCSSDLGDMLSKARSECASWRAAF